MNQFILEKIVNGLNATKGNKDLYENLGWEHLLELYKQAVEYNQPSKTQDFSEFKGWKKIIIDNKIHAIYHINQKNTNKWIVACHGYSSSKESSALSSWIFNDFGYNILAFDFLNHGESADGLVTFGVNEVKTLEQVINYLNNNFVVKNIGLVGFSMGAHTVNIYTLKNQATHKKLKVKFMVSDSTYFAITEVLAILGRLKFQLIESIFNSLLNSLINFYASEYHIDLLEYNLQTLAEGKKTTLPGLFFHTKADKVTNYLDSERIFAMRKPLTNQDAIQIFTKGEHLQAQTVYYQEYWQALADFLKNIK